MNYLIESSICLLMFYGLYHFLFKDSTKHAINRIYLLSSLILSALIPILSLPIFRNKIAYAPKPTSSLIGRVQFIPDGAVPFDWSLVWFNIYLVGVIISFLILSIGIYKILSIIVNGDKVRHCNYTLIYTNSEIPLCSFGKYIIAPSHRKEDLTEYELTHEINHLKNFHTLDVLFIKLFRCLFWFNPIVLLYDRRLIEIHEYQADSATLNHLGRESYLSFIVDQVSIRSKHPLVHNFNSLIKKRLIMMSSESRSGSVQYLAIIPVLLVVLSLFSFDSYPEHVDNNGNEHSILNDTIPDGIVLDTLYTAVFNMSSKKEVPSTVAELSRANTFVRDTFITQASINGRDIKWLVIKEKGKDAYIIPSDDPLTKTMLNRVDTISIIDYATYIEQMISINYKSGVIDTLVNEW